MNYADLLIEIHTGELPPKSLLSLANFFLAGIVDRLNALQFSFKGAKHFATPRRLAVLVESLADQQPKQTIVKRGPALQAAFDQKTKEPTKAALGFARSLQLPIDQLVVLKNDQGEWLGYEEVQEGKSIEIFLPTIVEDTLTNLPAKRKMRFGENNAEFVRPIHSILLLFGDKVVSGNIFGIETGRKTRGHRFHAPSWIDIDNPTQYSETLRKAYVIVDFEERKNLIVGKAETALTNINNPQAKLHIASDEFLNEVTGLVEWPEAILGSFDPSFLVVPKEALISSMQDHQRYFPIIDDSKKLLPHFVLISNIESTEPAEVLMGNERVLDARLSDASFFYHTDQKENFKDRLEKLKGIIFQTKLGTLYDKAQRLSKLTMSLVGNSAFSFSESDAKEAALLSKIDLTTLMVNEFPELQGIMGSYYVLSQTKNSVVAEAIREHYFPRFSGDHLPRTSLGIALAVVDRIDNLVGLFGINQLPTGEKDPFGLRRAAISIIRMFIENKIHFDLRKLIEESVKLYDDLLTNKEVVPQLLNFFADRMRVWLQEQGYSADIFAALNALNLTDIYDIALRAEALQTFRMTEVANDLLLANKRVSNILSKEIKEISLNQVKTNLFKEKIETTLYEKIKQLQDSNSELCNNYQYQAALAELSELHSILNEYFDQVMIMTDDNQLRENRLFMLSVLRSLFMKIADIALLQ